MPIPTYTPGYPPDGSSLGQTKTTIRNNLDGTFQTLAVDHIDNNGNPGAKPAGYHKVIHIVPNSGDPTLVSGIGQLYSKSVNSGGNTDTALFWETGGGGGRKLQLTSNFIPQMGVNGFTFLPGSASSPVPIIQWGTVSVTGPWPTSPQTLTFATSNRAFPTACFNVLITFIGPTSSSVGDICINSVAADKFVWQFTGSSSSSFGGFYWTAIGN